MRQGCCLRTIIPLELRDLVAGGLLAITVVVDTDGLASRLAHPVDHFEVTSRYTRSVWDGGGFVV